MVRRLLLIAGILLAARPLGALPDAAAEAAKVDGRIRINYGVQQDNSASFSGPTYRDSSYVDRLLQGIFHYRSGPTEVVFDGYIRQQDGASWDTSGHTRTLNQFFATFSFGEIYKLKLGRQRALWGHGFAYVPSDFINPPLDPAGLDLANAKGVNSATLDIYHGQSTVTLLYNADQSADRRGYGLKLTNSAFANLDWNLVYYHSPQTGHAGGLTFSTDPVAWLTSGSDGSLHLFANFALRERTPYYEAVGPATGQLQQPTVLKQDQPFFTYLVGLSHEFSPWSLSSRLEYYSIEDAYGADALGAILSGLHRDRPTFSPWIDRLAYGRSQRHYVNVAVGQTALTQNSGNRFTNTLGYGVGALRGLNDDSTLFSLNLNSSFFDRAEIELTTFLPVGRRNSEFGTTPFKWKVDLSISLVF